MHLPVLMSKRVNPTLDTNKLVAKEATWEQLEECAKGLSTESLGRNQYTTRLLPCTLQHVRSRVALTVTSIVENPCQRIATHGQFRYQFKVGFVIYNVGSGANPTLGKLLKTHLLQSCLKYITRGASLANQKHQTKLTFYIEANLVNVDPLSPQ
jgi:hypothetical protein